MELKLLNFTGLFLKPKMSLHVYKLPYTSLYKIMKATMQNNFSYTVSKNAMIFNTVQN